jgi:hypothetical protein
MGFIAHNKKYAADEKRQDGGSDCAQTPPGFEFPVRNPWRVDHPETELLPVPGHHLPLDFLTIQGVETIPRQGIDRLPDLLLDEFLVLFQWLVHVWGKQTINLFGFPWSRNRRPAAFPAFSRDVQEAIR